MKLSNEFRLVTNLWCRHNIATKWLVYNGGHIQNKNEQLNGSKFRYESRWYLVTKVVGSTDRPSSQQLQLWFSEHFFAPNLLRSLSRLLFLLRWNKYGGKNVLKPHSIRLFRWFNFSQSESRKNNRKAFEGASMGPTKGHTKFGANRLNPELVTAVHSWKTAIIYQFVT